MSIIAVLQVIVGVPLLMLGADWLVRHASRLALAMGISALVVGLTVVAYGTSSPELAVTFLSALRGSSDLAMGNIVGSNIANVLLVLGLSAVIGPLKVTDRAVHINIVVMIAVSCLLMVQVQDGRLTRADGVVLVVLAVAYSVVAIQLSRRLGKSRKALLTTAETVKITWRQTTYSLAAIAAGVLLLVVGADQMVAGASKLAEWLGISSLVIGLTVVAVGTSLPELATSCWAAWRGEREIAVGNAVGSNIINILGILGLTAIAAPDGVPVPANARDLDLPVMLAVSFASLPVLLTGYKLTRWEGILFLVYYAAYVIALYGRAVGWFTSQQSWWYLVIMAPILVVAASAAAQRLKNFRGIGKTNTAPDQ
ncbi:MAG: sodium:calcium antiporter [Pirellulaceae bacterium]|nr:MAG: sodium:calcium antiporter [Pirellulaceae bacterium]